MNPDAPAPALAQGAAAPAQAAAAPAQAAVAPAQAAAAPAQAAAAPAQAAAAPARTAGAPAQQDAQVNAAQDQQDPQDRQAPANQAQAAGPAANADRQPRREGAENDQGNDPDLNDVPEGEQHRHEGLDITPEQLAEAEVLIANRKTWIQELAPELDKKARKDLTELAHNVIFTSEHTARDAFEMSLANIQHRRQIHEALGRELNTSSDSIEPDPAPPAQKAPSLAAPHPKKRQASEEVDKRAKKRRTSKGRSKKKGKSKSRTKDSSSDDDSSTDSSSCSSSSQRSFSSDDSSDSEDSSDEENPKWVAGKSNSRVWGSLNIPDRVARKVDKGEYVDLWWFTPQSLKLKHEEKSRKHLTLEGGTLRTAEPAKPSGFLEDEDLDWDDFLYAIDKWMDTMEDEDIVLKTRKAWDRFNSKVRKHQQREKPRVKKALQILHQWQRKCFAHDTRQTKNKRKKIRRDTKLSDAEKAKRLDVLRQFDPEVWPKRNFKRILKELKERSDDRVENELALFKASVAAGFAHSSTSAGPSRKTNSSAPPSSPHPGNRNSSKPKGQQPFGPGATRKTVPAAAAAQSLPILLARAWRRSSPPTRPAPPSRPTTNTASSSSEKEASGSARGTTTPRASTPLAHTHTSAPSAERVPARDSDAPWSPQTLLRRARRLDPEGWSRALRNHGLLGQYHQIVPALREGISIGIQPPIRTYIAAHHLSATSNAAEVERIIAKELELGRYSGPHEIDEVRRIVGPHFQTSPLGLRPKPNGKFRPIQDFSHDPKPNRDTPDTSINAQLHPDEWPTTWNSFRDMCAAILRHPRTAQAFVRDVVSAFRQIPMHPSQWAGTVVEWNGAFYVDLFLAFGLGPACGVYGLFADAFADIVRAEGLATTAHWVDDNVFIRVLQRDLPRVNIKRKLLLKTITGGPQRRGGRLFWTSTDGVEHTEDYAQPLKSQPGAEDGYNCSLADIDRISAQLGWPWEPEKDSPWSTTFKYAGIVYNIATREVALPESKREKYLATIAETREQAAAQGGRHQLPVIEKLHGQCQWARNVYTEGKWHLAGLQAFIKTASQDRKLRHQWRHGGKKLADDIDRWERTFRCQDNTWRSFDPATPVDIDCYCDGSTSFGVGLSIQGRERAYPLRDDAVGITDIKTVEALALELAVRTAIELGYSDRPLLVHTDNTAVLGAFKKGRMAAAGPDEVLRRVAVHETRARLTIHLRWVDTKSQRADPRPAASSRPTSPASLSRAWMQSWAGGSGRAGSRGQPADGGDGEDPPEKKGRAPERGHAVQTKVLKTTETWRHLLEDWKEKSIKKRTPQARPESQELTYVPTPRAPTPSSTPTPETSALKPPQSFASGNGLPFVPPKPKKRNGPNKPEQPHPGRSDGRPS